MRYNRIKVYKKIFMYLSILLLILYIFSKCGFRYLFNIYYMNDEIIDILTNLTFSTVGLFFGFWHMNISEEMHDKDLKLSEEAKIKNTLNSLEMCKNNLIKDGLNSLDMTMRLLIVYCYVNTEGYVDLNNENIESVRSINNNTVIKLKNTKYINTYKLIDEFKNVKGKCIFRINKESFVKYDKNRGEIHLKLGDNMAYSYTKKLDIEKEVILLNIMYKYIEIKSELMRRIEEFKNVVLSDEISKLSGYDIDTVKYVLEVWQTVYKKISNGEYSIKNYGEMIVIKSYLNELSEFSNINIDINGKTIYMIRRTELLKRITYTLCECMRNDKKVNINKLIQLAMYGNSDEYIDSIYINEKILGIRNKLLDIEEEKKCSTN